MGEFLKHYASAIESQGRAIIICPWIDFTPSFLKRYNELKTVSNSELLSCLPNCLACQFTNSPNRRLLAILVAAVEEQIQTDLEQYPPNKYPLYNSMHKRTGFTQARVWEQFIISLNPLNDYQKHIFAQDIVKQAQALKEEMLQQEPIIRDITESNYQFQN